MVPAVMTGESSPPSSSGGHDDAFVSAESSLVDDIEGEEQGTEIENEDESRNEEMADLREEERAHLELWLKNCADLRSVEFLSGKIWHAREP